MIRKLSLVARLTLGFSLVLALTFVVGGIGIYKLTTLSDITQDLHDHPFTVTNSLLTFKSDTYGMRSQLLSVLSGESTDLERAVDKMRSLDLDARKHLALAGERYLGPKQDFQQLRAAYADWDDATFVTVALLRDKGRDQALRHQRETVLPLRERLFDATETMVYFASNRAVCFMNQAKDERGRAIGLMAGLLAAITVLSVAISVLMIRSVAGPVRRLVDLSGDIALGKELREQPVRYRDEIGRLEEAFNAIIASNNRISIQARTIAAGVYGDEVVLRSPEDALGMSLQAMNDALVQREQENRAENWLKSGQNELNESMRGTQDLDLMAAAVLGFLAERLHARVGCLYLFDERESLLRLQSGYACAAGEVPEALAIGEGLAGQAAADRRMHLIDDLPPGYLRISSATGGMPPRHLLVAPFMFQERLLGVVELASLEPFNGVEREFVSRACAILGPAFNIVLAQRELQRLLETTMKQAEELRTQQDELAAINEELEEQTQALLESELHLKEQREELRTANEELEQKTHDLEVQRERLLHANRELEEAQLELEHKAEDLERASRYKSDFLANMSHELRTPLNSLLILARELMDNRSGNLVSQQVESAQVIHRSGIDLLNLINDILDLAKIEAGRMDFLEEELALQDVADALTGRFLPQTRAKGIELLVALEEGTPETVRTDRQRLEQILNNLVSNAVKFTETGSVEVTFAATGAGELSVSVRDTGIGIAADKLQTIFETFRQAESGTSRRYGGSGLGLAIARNLAQLLGGSIEVESAVEHGSTFRLRLPLNRTIEAAPAPCPPIACPASAAVFPPAGPPPEDDRASLAPGERSILIVEDDAICAATVRDVCRRKNFKALCAATGEEGLALAREHRPTAVILDLRLPGMSGWQVLEAMKADAALRHIPVHIMSCESPSQNAYTLGAVGFLSKPASHEELERSLANLEKVIHRNIKELLLVEDDDDLRLGMERLIANDDIVITAAASGAEALAAIGEKTFDCMVLDLGLPDMCGFKLLKRLRGDEAHAGLPVIVYTGRELSRDEERELRQVSESIIVKGARSEERLVDETSIFLHRVVSNLTRSQQQHIINLHDRDFYLQDKVVLLVDDDMRNLFALSRVLEQRGLKVLKAEAGEKALSILRDGKGVDIILMDIMMPELDGYQTTRTIRDLGIKTPIIALTAKAMKEDRDKCIAAGADDYLPKPVDTDRLMSMMRVWLYA